MSTWTTLLESPPRSHRVSTAVSDIAVSFEWIPRSITVVAALCDVNIDAGSHCCRSHRPDSCDRNSTAWRLGVGAKSGIHRPSRKPPALADLVATACAGPPGVSFAVAACNADPFKHAGIIWHSTQQHQKYHIRAHIDVYLHIFYSQVPIITTK